MSVRAGTLRTRIDIQATTGSQDSFGGVVDAASVVMRRWAEVEALSGTELFQAQQVQAEVTHRVTMRWCADVTPQHRITFDGRTLEIVAVLRPGSRGAETVLLCSERPGVVVGA